MAEDVIKRIGTEVTANVSSAVKGFEQVSQTVSQMQKDLDSVSTSKGADELTNFYKRVNAMQDQVAKNVRDGLKIQLPQMSDHEITRFMTDAQKKLTSAQNNLLVAKPGSQTFLTNSKNIAEAETQLGMLRGEMAQRMEMGGIDVSGADTTISKLQQLKSLFSSVKGGMSSFSDKIGALGRKFFDFGKRVASAINPLKHLRNEENRLSLSSTLLGRAFLKVAHMFRLMVTRMLIRGFISNFREGFKNIAQYSEEVNRAFSRIGQSAHTLYNSFAAAFTPIIQTLAPYVVKLLDTLTAAMNKVAEFMSALTGKSYFIKATKYNYDYAKSLDKTSKKAGKTAKKLKELKSTTIGIDKLNVIEPNKPTNASSGSGNGNNGANVNDMFDTKPVSKKMKDLAKEVRKIAKKLFDPIQKAWKVKGKSVMKAWKNALKSIWKTTKAVGRDFLKVWGQKKTQKIFENIFDIWKDIGLVVKNLSDNFRKAWKRNEVGKRILENIRDIVFEISKGFKKAADNTVRWGKKINFTPILESLERLTRVGKDFAKYGVQVLSDFYTEVLLPISKWTMERGLPRFIDILSNMGRRLHLKEITSALKDFWKAIEPFAEQFGEGLLDFFDEISTVPVDIINTLFGEDGSIRGMTEVLNETDPQVARQWGKSFGEIATGLLLFKGLTKVVATVGVIAGKIKKLASALQYLGETNPAGFEMGVIYGAEAIDKTFKGLFPRIYGYLMDWSEDVNLYVEIFAATIKNIFVDLAKTLGNIIMTPFKLVGEALKKIAEVPGFEWLLPTAQQFDFAYNKVRSLDELIKDSKNEGRKKWLSSLRDGFYADDKDINALWKNGKPTKKDIQKYAQLSPKEIKRYISQQKKYKISVSDFFDSSAEKSLKKKAKKWGVELPKSFLKGLKEGRYVIPKNQKELERQVAFDKLLKKSKAKGSEIPKALQKGIASGKVSAKNVVKYEELLKKAKEKSPQIAEEIAKGIKGNKRSVKSAIDKLNAIIDTTSKKREAKVGVKKDNNFNKTLGEIQKSLNKRIPKTIAIRVSAKLDTASFTKASKTAVALSKIAKSGGTLKKQVRGADGHTYAYYTDKNGKTRKKKLYASGGFPKLGSEFIAGEKGAEFVGNINGKTGVASNQEITGIRDSIESSSSAQNQILIEQNNLLRALLEKNTDIVLDGEKVTKKVNKINARSGYRMAT